LLFKWVFFYNFGNFEGYFGFSGDVQYQRRERTTEGGREDRLTRKDMSNQHNFGVYATAYCALQFDINILKLKDGEENIVTLFNGGTELNERF
jgi:hypothetical protein